MADPDEVGVDPNEVDPNEVDPNKINFLLNFLNKEEIVKCQTIDVSNLIIPREILLDDKRYEDCKKYLKDCKQFFSSSSMTALQTGAETAQKWPLLNFVRQLCKSCNYKMIPKRICDGYSVDGKKKYKRIFIIEKMITM